MDLGRLKLGGGGGRRAEGGGRRGETNWFCFCCCWSDSWTGESLRIISDFGDLGLAGGHVPRQAGSYDVSHVFLVCW